MSTESKAISPDPTYTMDVNLISILRAVVLGSTLIEFNKLLFPPKVTSVNFWALFSVYWSAFASWFVMRISTRYRPYTDSFNGRLRVIFQAMSIVTHAGLLYFASRATDSLAGYMRAWPILFSIFLTGCFFRQRDLHLPEPFKPLMVSLSIAIVAATAYTVWSSVFPPVPDVALWGFVFAAFANVAAMRLFIRWQHTWRPEYDKRRVKQ
ncbi:hypothetical protein ES703_103013 [subsurface metagenome]